MYSVLHSFGFCLMLLLGAFLHWRLAMAVPAILTLPTMVLYRSLEVQQTSTTAKEVDKINVQKKYPPLYKDGQ